MDQDILFLDHCFKDEGLFLYLVYLGLWLRKEEASSILGILKGGGHGRGAEKLIGNRFSQMLYLSFWVNKSVTETA